MMATVTCPDCRRGRRVSPAALSMIRSGVLSGRCIECALAVRKSFELQRSWATLATRFWAKVDKTGDCWLWTGGRDRLGYGGFMLPDKKQDKAHRVAWTLTQGQIPEGMHVLHGCDNPPCVNPAHLFLGTHSDNMQDMARKGRRRGGRARLTHCKRGHERTPENVYASGNCKVCAREGARARRRAINERAAA